MKTFDYKITKKNFYTLSFTHGIIMTIIGAIGYCIMRFKGYKSTKFGYCWVIQTPGNWGGLSLGPFIFVSKCSKTTLCHEHGHAIQNCELGIAFPFVVGIPSAIRYWYRELITARNPKIKLPPYDSVWFEGSATETGVKFAEYNNIYK